MSPTEQEITEGYCSSNSEIYQNLLVLLIKYTKIAHYNRLDTFPLLQVLR